MDDPKRSLLFTDLYQLTMAQAYLREGLEDTAVFEMFFRTLPPRRNWMVAAGLADCLDWLETLEVGAEDLDYLRGQGIFEDWFLNRLAGLRFNGTVNAVPEGTVVFPNEPILQVAAPILEGQLAETFLLNQIHGQTVLASKAARVVLAARGKPVVEFGSRRAHGADAALQAARCAWMVGAAGTSNVLAGKLYGIPIFGTMAHSYIEAHDDEETAFAAFTELYPETTLLVDTYDTIEGVRKVIDLARRRGSDFRLHAVRLDSGDMDELARRTRSLLDQAGLASVRILVSGGLDEDQVAEFVRRDAPIDIFGVGTRMAVADDAPTIDLAYKLVEYAGRPRMKTSTAKVSFPGRKAVFRRFENERMAGDTLALATEQTPGEPLLQTMILEGKRTSAGRRTMADQRRQAMAQLETLPEDLKSLDRAPSGYEVAVSPGLKRLTAELQARLTAG